MTITLHGLGFITVPLEGGQRLQIWHPDLPKRENADDSAIRSHSDLSTVHVLKGAVIEQNFITIDNDEPGAEGGAYDMIDRTGGGAAITGRCDLGVLPSQQYEAGSFYRLPANTFHRTTPVGTTVLLVQMTEECGVDARTLITHGLPFDTGFDAGQLDQEALVAIMNEAMAGVVV